MENKATIVTNRKGQTPEVISKTNKITQSQKSEKTTDSKNVSQVSEKQEFIERYSILDDWNQDSLLNKSIFKGFYVAGIMFAFFILGMDPILRYFKQGEIFPLVFYKLFEKDLFFCISHWPLFYSFSYMSLLFQKAILKGYSERLCQILQHICELSMFGYTMYVSQVREWGITHVMFLTFLTCTHYFKMHSYRVVNAQYRKEKNPAYPANINVNNFTLYMWMPVLVYRHEYPRNKSIDYKFIAYKSIMTALGIMFGYIICCDHLIPYIHKDKESYWFETMLNIIFPFTVLQIVMFWLIFENILNVFAEITRFADRQFYQDWWNSTTFDEYNRKWNRPVHTFLYQHVYLECLNTYGYSKKVSQIVTFVFSAILHEWVFCLIFSTIKPVITLFMLYQIPHMSLTKSLKGKSKGNYLFWFGMVIGPALICVGYLRIDVI